MQTLQPLQPITVSSVDSGNLAASLYTLRTGAEALLRTSLLSAALFRGVATHWQLMHSQKDIPAEIAAHALPAAYASLENWCAWSFQTAELPAFAYIPDYLQPSPDESIWWLNETRARLRAITSLIADFLPWLLPEFTPLRQIPALALHRDDLFPTLEDAEGFADQLEHRLSRTWATLNAAKDELGQSVLVEKLRSELPATRKRLKKLVASIRTISSEAFLKAEAMDFTFLAKKDRQLLSIGYDVETGKLHSACYDMLASEARIATFIAVSRGELPQLGWFKMGRAHTSAFGHFILLSWTGTMFEYLMPSLWMRSYPDTLIARSLAAAVEIQRRFAQSLNIPWGISESGYGKTDEAGHYHYQAFGIPQISLKWDALAGPVISPYSTFLALGVDSAEALRNLHRMDDSGWSGAYGFYESADFSQSTQRPVLVREWMAHHQGMAILAILNLLEDNSVQEWFHANRVFQASELLLHEKAIRKGALKAEQKQNMPRRAQGHK